MFGQTSEEQNSFHKGDDFTIPLEDISKKKELSNIIDLVEDNKPATSPIKKEKSISDVLSQKSSNHSQVLEDTIILNKNMFLGQKHKERGRKNSSSSISKTKSKSSSKNQKKVNKVEDDKDKNLKNKKFKLSKGKNKMAPKIKEIKTSITELIKERDMKIRSSMIIDSKSEKIVPKKHISTLKEYLKNDDNSINQQSTNESVLSSRIEQLEDRIKELSSSKSSGESKKPILNFEINSIFMKLYAASMRMLVKIDQSLIKACEDCTSSLETPKKGKAELQKNKEIIDIAENEPYQMANNPANNNYSINNPGDFFNLLSKNSINPEFQPIYPNNYNFYNQQQTIHPQSQQSINNECKLVNFSREQSKKDIMYSNSGKKSDLNFHITEKAGYQKQFHEIYGNANEKRYINRVCFKCGMPGHIKTNCPS
jgi:hypothetical protein